MEAVAGGNKGVHVFSSGINRKVNIIVRLEFELAKMPLLNTMTTTPQWLSLMYKVENVE